MSTNEDAASRRAEEAKEQRRRDRNMRRRTRYAQMSPERKQSFLLKLQAKRAESKKRRLNPHSSNTLSLMEAGTQSQRQGALTVGDRPLESEEGRASEATNVSAILDKENNMIDCLAIFEVGSTSGTCNTGLSSTPAATAHRGFSFLPPSCIVCSLLTTYTEKTFLEATRNRPNSFYLSTTCSITCQPSSRNPKGTIKLMPSNWKSNGCNELRRWCSLWHIGDSKNCEITRI